MRLSLGIVLSGKMSSTVRYVHVQRVCRLYRGEFLQLNGLYNLYGVDEAATNIGRSNDQVGDRIETDQSLFIRELKIYVFITGSL